MPTQGELYKAFKEYDANDDGSISVKEINDYLSKSGVSKSQAECLRLMSEFDSNGDGQLDIMEFCDLMSSSKALPVVSIWKAKGVGMAFEFLNEQRQWQRIGDQDTIKKLGDLCSDSKTREVYYGARGQNYRATQNPDGTLRQVNTSTNAQRDVRLVPFFFEFEEGPRDWRPVTAPEALTSLTAVLASSRMKTYRVGQWTYEAILLNEQGLIQQCNTTTKKLRRVRCTPVGPDGTPHFEFREGPEGSGIWKAVSPSCLKQLAAVAVDRGEAYYEISYPDGVPPRVAPGASFKYHARLDNDGFCVQKNTATGAERPLRPAPWLGLASEVAVEQRVDPTEGYVPRRGEEEQQAEVWEGRRKAEEFYVPEVVPMGLMEAPVVFIEPAPEQVAQPVYFYNPVVEQPLVMAQAVNITDPNSAGLAAAAASPPPAPKKKGLFAKMTSFGKGIHKAATRDDYTEDLKVELNAHIMAKCTDDALRAKVDMEELLLQCKLQLEMGISRHAAIDKSVTAAIYIAKNTS